MELNPIFTSHMVLQANKPIRIFGKGKGHISASIEGLYGELNHAEDSDFCLELPPMDYGGPYLMTIRMNEKTVVLEDVCLGDVFFLSGQSNIQFVTAEDPYSKDHLFDEPLARVYALLRPECLGNPAVSTDISWTPCTKENANGWSAIGYFLALELVKKHGRAVGMIAGYQGASVVESWLPKDVANLPEFYLPVSRKSVDHIHVPFFWNEPGYLYDFTFRKITPYSMHSVIWYQGESDATVDEDKIYPQELARMIDIWRKDLKDNKLPFIIIQIADYDARPDDGWKNMQKAQEIVCQTVPDTKLIISRDVCESDSIHPLTKHRLSKRIAEIL